MADYILLLVTVPDQEKGREIARCLVEERLAACVTVSGSSRSFYWWEEKIAEESEHILFIKTRASLYLKLEEKIRKLHPYEVPEIIALPILKGYEKYLAWLHKETKS